MTRQQDDPALRGPSRLATPRVPVVRLNRRILYVIGGALVAVVLAGLVALRAQGSRLAHDPNPQASRVPAPSGEHWFDKVPDREPVAPAASTAAPPRPGLASAGAPAPRAPPP